MRGPRVRAALLIAFAVVCTVFGAGALIEPDAIGLALAIDQQDVRLHQPPPPGFVLYVWFAQFVDAWIDNPWMSLRVVALVTLLAAAMLTSRLAARTAGASAATLALLAFVSSPLVLFHGMIASSFPADALVSALTAFLCARAFERGAGRLRVESYVLGLVCGLRANALVFAVPLWVWTVARSASTPRERVFALLAWGAGTVCWLVPQVEHAGGFARYAQASWTLLIASVETAPAGGAWGEALDRVRMLLVVALAGLGVARLLFLALVRGTARQSTVAVAKRAESDASGQPWRQRAFWMLWLLPGLAWTLLGSHTAPGALLGVWPGLCVLFAAAWASPPARRFGVRIAVVATLLDVGVFFAAPVSELRDANALFAEVTFFHKRTRRAPAVERVETLRAANLAPQETLFLSSDPEQRALAYVAPEMYVLHADARRPEMILAYRQRRAHRVEDTYEVAAEVRWVVVAGNPDQFSPNPLQGATWSQESVDGMQIVEVGSGTIDAWFVPDDMAEAARQVHLVRGLPPPDPSDAALQRADRGRRGESP